MLHRIALAVVLCTLMLTNGVKAFAEKDKLEGLWYNEEKTAKVQIYRAVDNKLWGKIVWLKEPNKDGKPRVDEKNSKTSLRTRPLLNMPILSHFVKKDENTYDEGEIYDPKNGKTYSCTITYKSDKELSIRGYIGISLIGRTTKWTRAE
jgi:uncharacterized protein (DUF2147 family)